MTLFSTARTHRFLPLTLCLLAGLVTTQAQNQVFFENFDIDHSNDGSWVTNVTANGYSPVDIYFNYASVGIPPAPNSTNNTTRGLKLQANLDPLVQFFPSGSSMSPNGFSISQNFEMRWDWWLNFNGPLNTGGAGSTQIGGAGFGTAATSAQVPTAIDSVFIGASGDGTGTVADYRVYSPAFSASLQDPSGVYAAGTNGSRNNSHAYYQATFPPVSAPAAQLALYPQQTNQTQGGSAGMKWHDISLKKVDSIITYTIDGLLIATIDITTNGTLGGANIVFGHFDINVGASIDPNATNLAFSLVDNVRITNFATVVSVTSTANALEAGAVPGTFQFNRTSSGTPLTVNYTVGGSATSVTDFNALSGSVTFGASDTSTNISVVPVDDGTAEIAETVVLNITDSANYQHGAGATLVIVDNEPQQLTLNNVSTQVYERTNDYATFLITRLGDTNAAPYAINVTSSGAAANNVDFYMDNPGTFEPGTQSKELKVYPIEDTAYEGHETLTLALGAAGGGEYTIGAPANASVILVDATLPPETVLFSDNFNTDSSANWTVLGAANDLTPDHTATFNYDYAGLLIPPAPHGSGDTLGVFLTANKDATGSAAAVNLYPNGQSFSGNYALRFDMLLSVVLPNAVSTEYVLFGVNHSGTRTNWHRNSPGGVPVGWTFDGVFYSLEADGANLGDYVNYSSPTTNNNPTALTSGRVSTTLSEVFKSPPYATFGVPANNLSIGAPTPIWVDVEVSQIGNMLTWRINNTEIFSTSNSTPYKAGNIMIGYNDAFDSIGLNSSYVVIDNVRVVALNGLKVTSVNQVGANMQIDFTFDLVDSPAGFEIQSASAVNGPYGAAAATITQLSPGTYRATVPKVGNSQFYRVRHR